MALYMTRKSYLDKISAKEITIINDAGEKEVIPNNWRAFLLCIEDMIIFPDEEKKQEYTQLKGHISQRGKKRR